MAVPSAARESGLDGCREFTEAWYGNCDIRMNYARLSTGGSLK